MAEYMSIIETADKLGLKVRTIREWIKTGRVDAKKIGKRWYIRKDIVESKEVRERAYKGREHSRRIKEGIELGMLARRGEDS